MGMDFVALMKYTRNEGRLLRVLDALEAGSPAEVQALAGLMHARGMGYPDHEPASFWEFTSRPELRNPRLVRRPLQPNLGAALRLPEGFSLTFGPDAVEVYHVLRWHFFLTDPELRRAMLDACGSLARLLGTTDCIVTSDLSPVVQAFRQGQSFDACLASAEAEDAERPSLADLYREIPLGRVMRTVERGGRRSQVEEMNWDVAVPPPEGWRRFTTWNSRGFWRPGLGGAGQPPFEEPPLAVERPVQPATRLDAHGWRTSDEPDAMLDCVLVQDAVDWSKVVRWACACLRRIWPLLATEPVRRAVEVTERFADGRTDRRSVENAAISAAGVRKGDRRATQAACLLAYLGSGSRRFPPGDVSRAVVDAVAVDPAHPARIAERRAHADLLRDLFGPDPFHTPILDPILRTSAVLTLAEAAYEERCLPGGLLDPVRLAVLADALEEAGATDGVLLGHLREPGPHVRGCFALDAVRNSPGFLARSPSCPSSR